MNDIEYVKKSLELHLFFDRIMKEHSFFIEAAFTEKDNNLKKVARDFKQTFSNILKDIIYLSNENIMSTLLSSNEIVTKNTLDAEVISSELTGIEINSSLTKKELSLKPGIIHPNQELINNISKINKQTIPIIKNLIDFKKDILNNVLSCKMYTTNYPLLISHIMNEAKMYHNLLRKVENKEQLTKKELYEQEVFWNDIMKEHAEFIRGLLDPSERELILTADKFAKEYNDILTSYKNNSSQLTNSLNETLKFRDFKLAGEEGILNCKIKSIITPLLADHVLREANHFIRILKSSKD